MLFLSRNFPLPVDHVQTESYLRKTDFTLLSDTIFGHISHSLHDPTYTKDRYLFACDRNTWVHLICIAYMHAFIPSCATFTHTDKWTTSKTLHWYFMYISFLYLLGSVVFITWQLGSTLSWRGRPLIPRYLHLCITLTYSSRLPWLFINTHTAHTVNNLSR